MRSHILGTVDLDLDRLARDLQTLAGCPFVGEDSEYVFGSWSCLALRNGTGRGDDAAFAPHDGSALRTEHGERLDYLDELVEGAFDTRRLKWLRVFKIEGGVLVSHRDLVDIATPYVRLSLPLVSEPLALHSEESTVFRMRAGEIWYLDARRVHSACGLSGAARVALCLDFEGTPDILDGLLGKHARRCADSAPEIVERPPLAAAEEAAIAGLSGLIDRNNFEEIVALLSRVHFYRRVHGAAFFEWLIDICSRSGDPALVDRARRYKSLCVGEDTLYERVG